MASLHTRLASSPESALHDELKTLAAAWPSTLQKLDSLPTNKITARLATLETAIAAGTEPPTWTTWMDNYHNLVRVSSKAWLEGFHYKPRADHELMGELQCVDEAVSARLRHGATRYERRQRYRSDLQHVHQPLLLDG